MHVRDVSLSKNEGTEAQGSTIFSITELLQCGRTHRIHVLSVHFNTKLISPPTPTHIPTVRHSIVQWLAALALKPVNLASNPESDTSKFSDLLQKVLGLPSL